jgi:hypothetical protein
VVGEPFAHWVSENPEAFSSLVGAVFLALRAVTKGKIGFKIDV